MIYTTIPYHDVDSKGNSFTGNQALVESPLYFLTYNSATKAVVTKARYCLRGRVKSIHPILICDTFPNLQAGAKDLGLIGDIGPDPPPAAGLLSGKNEAKQLS